MTRQQYDERLQGLRCAICDQQMDIAEGLHPDSLDIPGPEDDGLEWQIRHVPQDDDACGDDRRGWVEITGNVHSGAW
ncbi:MAG: hypothetical protein IT318_20225 [Anaerolineales bacterium]|nr:hypothetical protein [Anaerolineales bacterium]